MRKFKSKVQLESGLIIPLAAASGLVLTSDASGNASWQPHPNTLPSQNGWNTADGAGPAAATGWQMLAIASTNVSQGADTGAFTRNANGSITVRDTGWYAISTWVTFTQSTTGQRRLSRVVNGIDPNANIISEVETGANAGGYASHQHGPVVYLTAGSVISVHGYTDVSLAKAVFDFSIAAVGGVKGNPGPTGPGGISSVALELLPFNVYGHSYTMGVANQHTANAMYPNRVASRLRLQPTYSGVGGERIAQTWGRVVNGGSGAMLWTVGGKGIVLIDAMTNDVRLWGNNATAINHYKQVLRAIIDFVSAGSVVDNNNASIAYTGTWNTTSIAGSFYGGSVRHTVIVNDYAEVTWTGDACTIYTYGLSTGNGGGSFTITNRPSGTTVRTVDLRNYFPADTSSANQQYAVLPIKLSGYGAGPHTVRLTNTVAGNAYIDAVTTPTTDPPLIFVMKDPVLANWATFAPFNNGSDAARNAFAAAIDTVAAEYTNVVAVDGMTGWDKLTMLGPDTVHPNDRGHSALADVLQTALQSKVSTFTAGVHIL